MPLLAVHDRPIEALNALVPIIRISARAGDALARQLPRDGRCDRSLLTLLRSLRELGPSDDDLGVLIAAIERDGYAFVRFV